MTIFEKLLDRDNMAGGVGGEEERQCWVCFASEEDDPVAAWVHPCLCKGTTKWVHQVWIENSKCMWFHDLL